MLRELFVRNQEEDQRLKHLVSGALLSLATCLQVSPLTLVSLALTRATESTELQTAQERQLAELQQGIAMYQRLGLFFEHTGGTRRSVRRTHAHPVLSQLTRRVRVANQIIVRFTQIDARDPSRVFSFRIRIDAVTDRFLGTHTAHLLLLSLVTYLLTSSRANSVVDECNEDVAALDALVDALNDSGDLALFIRAMRRQFKQLVQ